MEQTPLKFLSYSERMFLHRHLSEVRHITLDPGGRGVLRIHIAPCRRAGRRPPGAGGGCRRGGVGAPVPRDVKLWFFLFIF